MFLTSDPPHTPQSSFRLPFFLLLSSRLPVRKNSVYCFSSRHYFHLVFGPSTMTMMTTTTTTTSSSSSSLFEALATCLFPQCYTLLQTERLLSYPYSAALIASPMTKEQEQWKGSSPKEVAGLQGGFRGSSFRGHINFFLFLFFRLNLWTEHLTGLWPLPCPATSPQAASRMKR